VPLPYDSQEMHRGATTEETELMAKSQECTTKIYTTQTLEENSEQQNNTV